MKYLLGLTIIILTVLNIDLIGSVLISYWYAIIAVWTIIYFFVVTSSPKPYEFPGSEKVLLISKWIIKAVWIFIATLIAFILFRIVFAHSGAEGDIVNINKRLNVAMKDNVPCFYIDSSEEINEFDIHYIYGTKYINNEASDFHENTWKVTSNKSELHIPFTSIVGKDQCIPYGLNNEIHTEEFKKIENDILYYIEIDGHRKNTHMSQNMGELSARAYFYLFKNPKTGKSEIVLASQTQIDNWETSMRMARLNSFKHPPSEENILIEQIDEQNTTIKQKDHK